MNEYEIATQKVLPYLHSGFKWPKNLISDYGRVPVQAGSSTYWADFVCYYIRQSRPYPYLIIEVKQPNENLSETVPQAEFYSMMLGSPFFCVTDGEEFWFFLCGKVIGSSVRLSRNPPKPRKEALPDKKHGLNLSAFPQY